MARAFIAIAIATLIGAAPGVCETSGTAATPPATPVEAAPAKPICAGDCCVIDDQLVCGAPPTTDPGTNPVVVVPPTDLNDILKRRGTEGLQDYFRNGGGMLNG